MRKKRIVEPLLNRTPPHSIDNEEILLGSIFAKPGSLTEAKEILKPEDFYKGSHQKIFAVMLECPVEDGIVSAAVVADRLTSKDELESIGGVAYLAHLMDEVPMGFNIKSNVEIIFRCSVERRAIEKAGEIIELALADKDPLDVFMAKVEDLFTELKEKSAGMQKSESLSSVSFDDLFGEGAPAITQTPYKSLNDKILGYGSSDLIITAGKSGMGKSAFCLAQIIKTAVEEGNGVVYCGAQMDKKRIFLRMIAQMCKLDFKSLLNGRKYLEEKREEIHETHKKIIAAPIRHVIIPDRVSLLDLQMSAITSIKELKSENDVETKLLIIENLQQLYWPGKDFGKDPFAEANFMIKKIKPWPQEMSLPVIVSSQLNRKLAEREDKRPEPTDIFGKDAEELAELILLFYRPNVYQKRTIDEPGGPERDAEIIIGKGGPPCRVPMTFWGDSMRWEDRINF